MTRKSRISSRTTSLGSSDEFVGEKRGDFWYLRRERTAPDKLLGRNQKFKKFS
jgi:hypothetical protein